MAIKTIDEYPFGLTWVVDEPMMRTSHALKVEGKVWLVDPVDEPEAIEKATELGEPAGVLQLLDRHNRDGAKLAERFGVLHVKVPDVLPGTPFEVIPVLRWPVWHEAALWWPEHRALVVAEAVGTNEFCTAGTGLAGVNPMLRVMPPSALRGYAPAHLLVGHGVPLHGPQAAAGLTHALDHARRDIPAFFTTLAKAARR